MLGLLGGKWDNDESTGHVTSRLALIGGTSTCHMVVYVSSPLELENLCES